MIPVKRNNSKIALYLTFVFTIVNHNTSAHSKDLMEIPLYQIGFRESSGTLLPNENEQPKGQSKTEVTNSDGRVAVTQKQANFKWKIFRLGLSWWHSSGGKESACNARDPGSSPVLGRSPGEGNGNPLQYPSLENSMDRGAWPVQSMGLQSLTQTHHIKLTLIMS